MKFNFLRAFSPLISFIVALNLISCGSEDEFKSAKKMERLGRYPSAIVQYEKVAAKHPKDLRSAEALYRIAKIYHQVIKNLRRARYYYSRVSEIFPGTEWGLLADEGIMNCPSYFPVPVIRVMGDSQSGGLYMKTEEIVEYGGKDKKQITAKRKIFAGNRMISEIEVRYEKKQREWKEFDEKEKSFITILKIPLQNGEEWESQRQGRKYYYRVEKDDVPVTVRAGSFDHCVKIKQQFAGLKNTWKYEYYAPEVGLVLTSAATANFETRVAELLSFRMKKKEKEPESKDSFYAFKNWIKKKFDQ